MLLLASMLTLSIGIAQGDRSEGLVVNMVTPEKVEGKYHDPNGYIQFSSEGGEGQHSIMVETGKGEPLIAFKKLEKAFTVTMRIGQTKFLVQMNQPGSGLPRYSDYVVPQAFHNLVDSVLTVSQDFIFLVLIQQLDNRNADDTRRRAIEDLAMRSEANSIIEAAKALGNAGVMGTDNPAAQQFYVLSMCLAKVKEMMQRGAVANNDGTLPTHHRMHSMYAYEQANSSCPECTTGRCPYMGDRSNGCKGMCGYACNCWWWLCGDCCVHQGCLDHDECCTKYGYWSIACLIPIGFSCSGYSCWVHDELLAINSY